LGWLFEDQSYIGGTTILALNLRRDNQEKESGKRQSWQFRNPVTPMRSF
jgi:hypothetical protein